MSKRYAMGKPLHPYKNMPKWATADSEKMIQNLHQIEKQIRHEILVEQVTLMPNGLLARKLKAGLV